MTVKERIIDQLDTMDEAQLMALETYLRSVASGEERLAEEFQLLEDLAAPLGSEDRRAFEAAVKRRPFFRKRDTETEPDGA